MMTPPDLDSAPPHSTLMVAAHSLLISNLKRMVSPGLAETNPASVGVVEKFSAPGSPARVITSETVAW